MNFVSNAITETKRTSFPLAQYIARSLAVYDLSDCGMEGSVAHEGEDFGSTPFSRVTVFNVPDFGHCSSISSQPPHNEQGLGCLLSIVGLDVWEWIKRSISTVSRPTQFALACRLWNAPCARAELDTPDPINLHLAPHVVYISNQLVLLDTSGKTSFPNECSITSFDILMSSNRYNSRYSVHSSSNVNHCNNFAII